ncbi:MAG TPA: energy transducer TonB [Bryobacteraceae bacterium]|nr:energy transducer TonB [Bryobacteraceae bacterium]
MFQSIALQGNRSARGPAMSLTIHGAVVALLFIAGANQSVRDALRNTSNAIPIFLPAYLPAGNLGGGGGDHSTLPAGPGRLPRAALKQFVPPSAVNENLNPRLVMEPAIVVSADVKLPQIDLAVFGDPLAKPGPPSNGPGDGGGIGTGCCGGVGPGKGPGAGPGDGHDGGFGRLRGFSAVSTAPVLIFKVEPEFSEEARKAKLQGVVVLYAEVDTSGRLQNIRVTRGLGLGLDDKALEAVKQWRFRPGYRDGKPVVESATIEVNFHLL